MSGEAWYVGADIGGTFTDLVLVSPTGAVATKKVLSTTSDYAEAIGDGLAELLTDEDVAPSAVASVSHGTTVATNAILEHNGARTGVLTTAGFRDVLEIRRLRMPRLYDAGWAKPEPLVQRDLRLEVPERIDAHGISVRELDEEAARKAILMLVKRGIESLAICFLHSYLNPDHEQRVARLVAELAPSVDVSASSDVLPQQREYERTSTTVVNAYVRPVVRRYLGSLRRRLRLAGIDAPLWVMQSNGGLLSAEAAEENPIHIIESGPAGGVVGAMELARRQGLANVITLDMGGTTAKASLVENGEASIAPEYEVGGEVSIGSRLIRGGGYILRVPALDIAEVGAGGGSVVWIDSGGSIRVGPRSAGALPGPVAYARGGEAPTLTDANVVLGYIGSLAGGRVPLDVERAREIFRAKVAEPLGLSLEDAAFGARRVANASMVRAVRAISVERGRDPREFILFAFGGNGPVHAADIAEEMSIPRIVVPVVPGVFSALGLCLARVAQHFARTNVVRLDALVPADLGAAWGALEAEARVAMAGEGSSDGALVFHRFADLRYLGQSNELTVPANVGPADESTLASLAHDFGAEHRRAYGHDNPTDPIEIVSFRVVATLGEDQAGPDPNRIHLSAGQKAGATITRQAYLGPEHGWTDVDVQTDAAALASSREGPLILDLYDATVVVPPGWTVAMDTTGSLMLNA